MKKISPALMVFIAIIALAGVYLIFFNKSGSRKTSEEDTNPPISVTPSPDNEINNLTKNNMHIITLETNLGNIKFETYDADAPKAVGNFINLAEKGFYDGLIFHRVVKGFVMQGGDPLGNGSGGPGYKFDDELNSDTESYKIGYMKGVVAMANSGPNTNGSQFFIMLKDYPLPHLYTIFGRVVEGQDVVDKIGLVEVDSNDKPLQTVIMNKVSIEDVK